jgi:lantibiotic leader peptide-processing serine protease
MRKGFLALTASVVALAVFAVAGAATGETAPVQYTVAFSNSNGLPANVDQLVANAGGKITDRIPQIGGIGVSSTNPDFASAMGANASVKAVAPSVVASVDPTTEPADLDAQAADAGDNGGTYSPTGSDAQPMPDTLGAEQWDKKKLNATPTGSYAVQPGRKDVRVFVIDTGADQTHPDVAPNLDVADSRSFVPTEPTIQDFHGHGTWTISAVGGPINGVGISGVAPNVTLVEGKVLNGAGSGLFLWTDEAMVYAGLQHFDVVSASLGGYIPKCGNNHVDAQGNPICDHPDYILLNRATQFARSNGVLPVAAAGNDGFDLSQGAFFRDFVEAPGEVPGWVTVSATGYNDGKAFYSNYGTSIDVSAPGGSTRDYNGVPGQPGPCPHGSLCRLIGAWSSTASSAPSDPVEACTDAVGTPPCAEYGYVQGTSMATPNVAGVAALIISQYGDFTPNNQNKPHMSPTAVESILQITANNQPCPSPKTVAQGPGFTFATATCQGDTGNNTFFGKGIVDALKAVTFKQ